MLGGGGVLGLLSVRPHFCWGGVGAAKGLLPYFLVPKGNQPTACTLALWWLKFGPTGYTRGGGGSIHQNFGRIRCTTTEMWFTPISRVLAACSLAACYLLACCLLACQTCYVHPRH